MESLKLILGSGSPRRKELLSKIGLPFEVYPSSVIEPPFDEGDPIDYAIQLAALKASDISGKFPDAIVVGADTIVLLDDQVLGKPRDPDQARYMLQLLSARTHHVITGYSIQHKNLNIHHDTHVLTKVHFKVLSDAEISSYVNNGDPFDKAGAYGIQDYSSIFVDHLEGCFYNVMGFPISNFYSTLNRLLDENNLTIR
ncbi:septum formation protein Maf [bacterium]|nr:septum formation protein Maf [bacterium]